MAAKQNLMRASSKIDKDISTYVQDSGQTVMARAMHLARLSRFNPVAHASLDGALKNDKFMNGYDQILANKAVSPSKRALATQRRANREKEITASWKAWEALGETKGGQAMFQRIMQFYQDMHSVNRSLLDQRIERSPLSADGKKRLMDTIRNTMEKAENEPDEKYPEFKVGDAPEVYFPFMRHGDFYLRVMEGPTGPETYFFDTALARNTFMRQRAAELGVPANDKAMFKPGNDLNELRSRFSKGGTDASQSLVAMMNAVDKEANKPEFDAEALKDQIWQLWLQTLPERSYRKQFLHSENRTGFSANFHMNFRTMANRYANQLPALMYADQVNSTARDAVDFLDADVAPLERVKLRAFLTEVASRVEETLNPPPAGKLVSFLNKFAFLWLLTSGASAATQLSAVPVRTMPNLVRNYGYGPATAKFTKYMQLWNSVGMVSKDADGNLTGVPPSIGGSKLVRESALNTRAWKELSDHAILMDNQATAALRGGTAPMGKSETSFGKISELTYNTFTFLFGTAENISRGMTAMMTFELEYERLAKAGVKGEEAFQTAVAKAIKTTGDTQGDYSLGERPSFLKGDLGRFVGLFKHYAVITTKFFVQSALTILNPKNGVSFKERMDTLHELTGVLAMGGLFHGVIGAPLYGVITATIDLCLNASESEDDKKKRRAASPYFADNSDYRFRYEWLPKHFGQLTIPGLDGKQHSLAKILMNGPISELSGVNIGTRTSFNNLWFRSGMAGETWADDFKNFILANLGPSVSLGDSMARAVDDFANGEVQRGVEKILPAFLKPMFTTYRLATEGAETRAGDKMLKDYEISDIEYAASFLGFQPTAITTLQNQRFEWKKQAFIIQRERSALTRRLNMALVDPEGNESSKKAAMDAIKRFNARHPADHLAITLDTISDSFDAFTKNREIGSRGLFFSENEIPYVIPGLKAASPQMGQ
jgi:hypothetical protein